MKYVIILFSIVSILLTGCSQLTNIDTVETETKNNQELTTDSIIENSNFKVILKDIGFDKFDNEEIMEYAKDEDDRTATLEVVVDNQRKLEIIMEQTRKENESNEWNDWKILSITDKDSHKTLYLSEKPIEESEPETLSVEQQIESYAEFLEAFQEAQNVLIDSKRQTYG